MRIFNRFFTIIGLLTLGLAPANAQTIQQALRFKILLIDAPFLSGNPDHPGNPTDFSSTHSFTVTTDLTAGFKIKVDPFGPSQANDSGYTFFLVIYVDDAWVKEMDLGGLGSSTTEALIGTQNFVEGQRIVLTGEYRKPGKEATVVTMRWPFDENSTTYKEYSCWTRGLPSLIPAYGPFAFNYQPPTLTFNTTLAGSYKPYNPITPQRGNTDAIAVNYGTGKRSTEILFRPGKKQRKRPMENKT